VRADRAGLTLLEVLVALALLGIGGAAWLGLAGQSAQTLNGMRAREAQVQRAAQVMTRVSLWPRERLATFAAGGVTEGFRVHVVQLAPTLYQLSVADSGSGSPLISTSLHFSTAHAVP
jgi:prepilin-type N-terminal cleavage/methylation domain-containing protein